MRRAKQAKAAKQATRRVTCLLASEACNEQQAMRAMRVKCEASEASTGAHKCQIMCTAVCVVSQPVAGRSSEW